MALGDQAGWLPSGRGEVRRSSDPYSRNRKSLSGRFPYIVEPLRRLPDGIVVDGEIVALDDEGRPVFNLLQNFTTEAGRIRYFVFDLLCYDNRDLTRLPLIKRREMLRSLIKFDDARVKIAEYVEASAERMLGAVREQRLEGIVGKRKDSVYEPGTRSGAWIKHRVNLGQEFVIGGFTPGPHGLDAIIVGYYREDNELIYVARTRNGFVPAFDFSDGKCNLEYLSKVCLCPFCGQLSSKHSSVSGRCPVPQ